MVLFNDKCKHEVPYSLDYPFASEFYNKEDCRYQLTELYKSMVKEEIGVEPYNCKIYTPNIGEHNTIYNVILYFWDIEKVFTTKEYFENTFIQHKESRFTKIFYDALKQCPLNELDKLKLNPNGVFVEGYKERSLAYTASLAEKELNQLWTLLYPQIAYTTRWDSVYYLFFNTIEAIDRFVEESSVDFKKKSYDVMKKYDRDDLCTMENSSYILDLLGNYESIGGRNYFNSDAMDGLKSI
jgi:hypothetical protein